MTTRVREPVPAPASSPLRTHLSEADTHVILSERSEAKNLALDSTGRRAGGRQYRL